MTVIARALGVSRANLYVMRDGFFGGTAAERDQKKAPTEDGALLSQIRSIAAVRPTYGYRRITAILRRQGLSAMNHKKVYRVMKAANMLLQRHTGKVSRTHEGKIITLRSNTRWCTDAFGIQCWNG